MKARAAAVALAVLAAAPLATAQNIQASIDAYREASTWEQKREMLQAITRSATPPPAGFYAEALEQVVAARDARLVTREETARMLLKLELVRRVGLAGAAESAPVLHRVYVEERDYTLRGAALEALGRVGARAYLPVISEALLRLTASPEGGTPGEAMALGAIAGLEALGDPGGYAAVFYASFGPHSVLVRRRAVQALEAIAPDPTELLREVVRRDPSLAVRLEALTVQAASRASAEKKIATAIAVLKELAGERLDSEQQRSLATRVRSAALRALIDNETRDEEALPLLEPLMHEGADINLRLDAIEALGVMGSDRAVAALVESLKQLNYRQESGDRLDERVVRATIRALATAGKASARAELLRVRHAGYASGVVGEAERALERIR